jgi:hypothetical protein
MRERLGLPKWSPRKKAPPAAKGDPAFARLRLREVLRVLDPGVSREHFTFLINEARNAGLAPGQLAALCRLYDFTAQDLKEILIKPARRYTAGAAAKVLGLTYARRMKLKIRTIGAIDMDKAGCERARRDRWNAKRRAQRAAKRDDGVINEIILRADAARRAATLRNRELLSSRLCRLMASGGPLDAPGVNRRFPSSEGRTKNYFF